MEFILVTVIACGVFAFCFAVFLLKSHREGGPPRLHRCGEGPDCQCYGEKGGAKQPFDLVHLLEETKMQSCDKKDGLGPQDNCIS